MYWLYSLIGDIRKHSAFIAFIFLACVFLYWHMLMKTFSFFACLFFAALLFILFFASKEKQVFKNFKKFISLQSIKDPRIPKLQKFHFCQSLGSTQFQILFDAWNFSAFRHWLRFNWRFLRKWLPPSWSEAYLEPSRTSTIGLFWANISPKPVCRFGFTSSVL